MILSHWLDTVEGYYREETDVYSVGSLMEAYLYLLKPPCLSLSYIIICIVWVKCSLVGHLSVHCCHVLQQIFTHVNIMTPGPAQLSATGALTIETPKISSRLGDVEDIIITRTGYLKCLW